MVSYLADTQLLVQHASDPSSAFYTVSDASSLRSGNFSGATDLQIMPGTDQPNDVTISPLDQFVLGGANDDVFRLKVLTPGEGRPKSVMIIDGGPGVDVLALPSLQSFWTWTTVGGQTDIFSNVTPGRPLVAILLNVEYLHFQLQPNSHVSISASASAR